MGLRRASGRSWWLGILCAVALAMAGAAPAIPVIFRYVGPDAESVHLRGTFNGWAQGIDLLADDDGDGVWQLTKDLAPDNYEYKFYVDGTDWISDPRNLRRIGPQGNSALAVASPMLYCVRPAGTVSYSPGVQPRFEADVAWDPSTSLAELNLLLNGTSVASVADFDPVAMQFSWTPTAPLEPGTYDWELTAITSEGGEASEVGSVTLRGTPMEFYYDQFDWGLDNENLNLAFWGGGARWNLRPDEPIPPSNGVLRLGDAAGGYTDLVTRPISESSPNGDVELRARLRLTAFEPGPGERNAEISTRRVGEDGYLLTLDAGNGLVRLRRRGGNYSDLVPPVSHDFTPGEVLFLEQSVRGTNPVTIRARVANDSTFSSDSLIFDVTHEESDWTPQGSGISLQGYSESTPYTFDVDYLSLGDPGYAHPPEFWTRTGFTNSPSEPTRTFVGDLDSYEVTETGVVFRSGGMSVIVTPRLDSTVRVDVVPPGGSPQAASTAITRTEWPSLPFVVTDGDPVRIEAGSIRVHATRSPLRLSFLRPDGTDILNESVAVASGLNGEDRRLAFDLEPDDRIYGLGEPSFFANVPLDRRGHTLAIRNEHQPPSVLIFPVWISPRNYGVFIDNSSFGSLSFGASDPSLIEYRGEAGEMTYYVMLGDSMYDIVDSYTQLTGRPVLAPRWTLGNIQSKYGYTSFNEIQSIINGFQTRDIPLDGIVMDLDWFGISTMGNLEFQQNGDWPNPVQGMANLHAQGYRFIPITEPQITNLSSNAAEVLSQGLVATESDGVTPLDLQLSWITSSAPVYLLDFTNPATGDWWKLKHRRLIQDYQFDGFWQDLNEPEGGRSDMRYHGGSAAAASNLLAINMNRSLAEAMEDYRPGARPFIMSRSGSPGMQKYGATVWSGDVPSTFESLTEQVRLAQSMGLAGVPYWNSDIGGFNGTPSPELYLRWCQFGLFNPIYRPHGAQSNREPWRFGSEVQAAVRDVIRLRYQLIPYYYTVAREAYDSGAPIMRPLVMDWPDDPQVSNLGSQFLYGPSLLVRPVTEQGATQVAVYLPEGDWADWEGNTTMSGGQSILVDSPLAAFPLFVRTPTILPLGPVMNRSDAAPLNPITLRVFWTPEQQEARGSLYEDDGLTTDYQNVGFSRTSFTAQRISGGGETIVIGAAEGVFAGKLPARAYSVELPVDASPATVSVNGTLLERLSDSLTEPTAVGWSRDPRGRIIRLFTPPLSTDAAHTIILSPTGPPHGWLLE